MSLDRFPLIAPTLSARRATQFVSAISAIEQGTLAGSILNKTYKDARSTLNNVFDDAWRSIAMDPFIYAWKKTYEMSAAEQALESSLGLRPEVHTHKTFVKRIAASKLDTAYTKAMQGFLAETQTLVDQTLALADKVQKRETKAERETRESFQPKPVDSVSKAKVRQILTEIAEGARSKLEAAFAAEERRILNHYLTVELAYTANLPSKPTHYQTPYEYFVRRHKQRSQQRPLDAQTVERLLDPSVSVTEKPRARVDAEEQIVNNAKADADQVVRFFVEKNLAKIVSIVEAKGNLTTAKVCGDTITTGGLRGSIDFTFADGSRFTVCNSVVYVQNQYGTQFNRFPLTFHNVRLASGEALKQPSEKKMNEVFAKETV